MGQAPTTMRRGPSKKDLTGYDSQGESSATQDPPPAKVSRKSSASSSLARATKSDRTAQADKIAPAGGTRSGKGCNEDVGIAFKFLPNLSEGLSGKCWRACATASKTTLDPFAAAAILALVTGILNFFLIGQPMPFVRGISFDIFRQKDPTPNPGSLQKIGSVVQQPVKLLQTPPVETIPKVDLAKTVKKKPEASQVAKTTAVESKPDATPKTESAKEIDKPKASPKPSTGSSGTPPAPGLVQFGTGAKHPLYYRAPDGCGPVYDPADFFRARNFKKLTWKPNPDKFLFAYCFRGQISNRILCFRNTMILAALLNRTLVIPMRTEEQYEHFYDMRIIFHLDSARQCLGENTMLSTVEFEKKYNQRVTMDRLQCWHGPNVSCIATPGKKDKDCPAFPIPGQELNSSLPVNMSLLGIPTGPLLLDHDSHMAAHFIDKTTIPIRGSCLGFNISFQDAVREFGGYEDRMLSVGDMVDRFLTDPLLHLPFLELVFNLRPGCQTWKGSVLSPSPALLSRSYTIQKRLFGDEEYMAVHWRRGDFALYCFNAVKSSNCFYSPRQGANCTLQLAYKYGFKNVFLATNAPDNELAEYLGYIKEHSRGNLRVKRAQHLWDDMKDQERWLNDIFPGGNRTEQSQLAEATVQKLICARSRIFVGAQESTFTRDIMHIRFAMRKINCLDQLLCYGEAEWEDDFTGLSQKEVEMKLAWKERTRLHMLRVKEKEERRKKAEEAKKKKELERQKKEAEEKAAHEAEKEEKAAEAAKFEAEPRPQEAAAAEAGKKVPMLD